MLITVLVCKIERGYYRLISPSHFFVRQSIFLSPTINGRCSRNRRRREAYSRRTDQCSICSPYVTDRKQFPPLYCTILIDLFALSTRALYLFSCVITTFLGHCLVCRFAFINSSMNSFTQSSFYSFIQSLFDHSIIHLFLFFCLMID